MKSKPKPSAKPQSAVKPPAVKRKAKVLQHPSAPKMVPKPVKGKFEKKVVPEWNQVHGLTAVDFPDLLERRQTIYRKIKDLEFRLKGNKKQPETVKAALDTQIIRLMTTSVGVGESVQISEEGSEDRRLVTTYTGHSAERIVKDKLVAFLLKHLEVEVIEEAIAEATEGGEAYIALKVTDPKQEEE